MDNKFDIIIIGGGASGIMASLSARKNNKNISICILESGEDIGRKLRICGGGRCNFTNNRDIGDFFDNIVSNEKFLYSSLYSFTNEDMKDFVSGLGIEYIVEKENNNKVYLKSGNSMELIDKFREELVANNIKVFYKNKVRDIDTKKKEIKTEKSIYSYKKLIVASGGKSFPKTGSDGDILKILSKNKYGVSPFKPALSTIEIKNNKFKELAGTSVSDVDIYLGKRVIRDDLIFTHKGIGGPVSLKASSYISKYNLDKIRVDLIPDIDKDELYARVKNKGTSNIYNNLKGIVSSKLLKFILSTANSKTKELSLDFDYNNDKVANLSKKGFELLFGLFKDIILEIKSIGPIEYATISQGGIRVNQIDSSSMQSKVDKDVFFSGEIIDVDALTGGFNLQIAFSTGVLAGKSAAQSIL